MTRKARPQLTGRLSLFLLLAFAARRTPVQFWLGFGVTIVGGLTPIGVALASGDLVTAGTAAARNGVGSPEFRDSLWAASAVAGFFLLGQLLEVVRLHVGRNLAHNVTGHLASTVMSALGGPAGVAHLDDPEVRDDLHSARHVGSIEVAPGEALSALLNKMGLFVAAIGCATLLSRTCWWLGPAVFTAFAVCYFIVAGVYQRGVQASFSQGGVMRRAAYLRDVALTPTAAKELRIFGLLPYFEGAFANAWLAGMTTIWKGRRGTGWMRVVVPAVVALGYAVSLFIVGRAVLADRAPVGEIALAGVALRSLHAMLSWNDDDLLLGWGKAAFDAAFRLRDRLAPPETVDPSPAPPTEPTLTTALQVEAVSFGYRAEPPVLQALDLTIAAGSSIAIVGRNGAGKSTLVRLLAGLDLPQSGQIYVDGQRLDRSTQRGWQRRVAALFQDFARFEATLRENVAFGASEQIHDQDGLDAVADQVGLTPLIASLPLGWDTMLSARFEGGVDLSGGQWQRVALCRALFAMRHGAQLLILDEPAASLDIRAEEQLYEAFLALTKGCTTIIVSHRFASVKQASRIVVLEGGRIVEDGSHAELTASDTRYKHMFDLQARRFAEDVA